MAWLEATIGQSYSACASVNPTASVDMTKSCDNGCSGRGACILSCAQNPSISSGPGNFTCSAVSVIPYPLCCDAAPKCRDVVILLFYPQSFLLAIAAPSASALNFGHTTVGCTSGA